MHRVPALLLSSAAAAVAGRQRRAKESHACSFVGSGMVLISVLQSSTVLKEVTLHRACVSFRCCFVHQALSAAFALIRDQL